MSQTDPFLRMTRVYLYLLENSHVVKAVDYFLLDVYDETAKVRVWNGYYKHVVRDLAIPVGQVTTTFSHLVKMESIRSIAQGIWQVGTAPSRPLWDSMQSRDLMSGKMKPNGRIERVQDSQHHITARISQLERQVERLEYVVYAKNHAVRDSSGGT